MKSFKYISILFALTSLSFKTQTPLNKGNLKVVVTNIKNNTGQVAFFLFNSNTDFPKNTEKAMLSAFLKINGNTVEYTFKDIAMGTYAVSVYHDENSNKTMDTNFLGMPKEGIGASNNAKGHFGPPSYEDAKFDFNKPEQTIKISLSYL